MVAATEMARNAPGSSATVVFVWAQDIVSFNGATRLLLAWLFTPFVTPDVSDILQHSTIPQIALRGACAVEKDHSIKVLDSGFERGQMLIKT
jgi:hypothetical protein